MSNIKPSLCNVNRLLHFTALFLSLPRSNPSYDIQSHDAHCLFGVFLLEWIIVDFAKVDLGSYSHGNKLLEE